MGWFNDILKIGAPILGSVVGGPVGGMIGSAVGGLVGGMGGDSGGSSNRSNAGNIGGGVLGYMTAEEQKKYIQQMQDWDKQRWTDTLRANRPNQTSATGATSNWATDDKGNWSNVQKFGPEEQERRDLFNKLALDKMKLAGNFDLSGLSSLPSAPGKAKPIDWNALGFGHLANAALGQEGSTGKPKWADNATTSLGGSFLAGQGDPWNKTGAGNFSQYYGYGR